MASRIQLKWDVPSEVGEVVSTQRFEWDGSFLDTGTIKVGTLWIGVSYEADLGGAIDQSIHIAPLQDQYHHVVHSRPDIACPCKAQLLPLNRHKGDEKVFWQHWPAELDYYEDPYEFLSEGAP